jgi:NACalpha-BTF3-like transcription factor
MDSVEQQLTEILDRARKEMGAAMKVNEMDHVIRFARIAKDAEAVLRNTSAEVQRLLRQMESREAVISGERPKTVGNATPLGTSEPSRKARGKAARSTWLAGLRSRGVHLRPLGGRAFQTESGHRVGIAYASELSAHPDKWWMGLPEDHYDVVVLLCEESSGNLLDFVLTPDFVSRVWPRLTLSNGQREWHVVRSGPNYEMDPKKHLGKINSYLSHFDSLR